MELDVCIKGRRSVRAYTNESVSKEQIETVLEAGTWAPTGMHREPWKFIVIEDKQLIKYVSDETKLLVQQNMPPLAFLSFWNKKEGIEFAIVIDKCFKNIRAAQEAVGKLPPMIAAKTKILSQWDANTVFFNRRALQH